VALHPNREERVKALIRVGEQELTGEDGAEVDAYFAPDFAFHGPDGAELDYEGLKADLASLRAAFDDLTGIMSSRVTTSRQTTITGTFVREFTRSRSGTFPRTADGSCSSSSTSSDTATKGDLRRNGCRRTTEAGCVSWALKGAEHSSTKRRRASRDEGTASRPLRVPRSGDKQTLLWRS
jgi:hypothetical protein